MRSTYEDVKEERRLTFESGLIKTYLFEADVPTEIRETEDQSQWEKFVGRLFRPPGQQDTLLVVNQKDETRFFEVNYKQGNHEAILYVDAGTNNRFWIAYSMSSSTTLDRWLERIFANQVALDTVWLWPSFLEAIQARGIPRGFGLDYDYRRFEGEDPEKTTYLKMQLWGGSDTNTLYRYLKNSEEFRDKVVLSKIRVKEFANESDEDLFALQDLKYQGKFTVRGTDFRTHAATVSFVRTQYEKTIRSIEGEYSLRWRETDLGTAALEGFAIHFVPEGFLIPVDRFCERALNGTMPFRLLGITRMLNKVSAVSEVVDLHTGGQLSLEVHPDMISVYLPEGTCGNSIARLYTNLQHFLSVRFSVVADNGDVLF